MSEWAIEQAYVCIIQTRNQWKRKKTKQNRESVREFIDLNELCEHREK